MRKEMHLLLFIAVFFAHSLISAQDHKKNEAIPDPSSLTSNWWEFFTGKQEVVQKRADSLQKHLEKTSEELSKDRREEAENLIEQIRVNLQAWISISNQPLPAPKPASAYKDSYSIEALRKLFERRTDESIDLSSNKKELNDLKQQLVITEQQLDQALNDYQTAKERSQEKILYGLKILKLRPLVEVLRRKMMLLQQSIQIDSDQFQALEDEIRVAEQRLEIGKNELSLYKSQLNSAKKTWEETKRTRQEEEVKFGDEYSESMTDESKTNNSRITLKLIDVSVNETLAQIEYLRDEVIYQLAQIIAVPAAVDMDNLDREVREWKTQFKAIEAQINRWKTQSEEILQRGTQALSLIGEDKPALHEKMDQVVKYSQNTLVQLQKTIGNLQETQFLLDALESNTLSLRGRSGQWLKVIFDFAYEAGKASREQLDKTLFYAGIHPVSLITIIKFLLIMVFTWWFSKLITGAINTFGHHRKGVQKALIYRLKRLIHYLILFIGALVGLSWIGFDFSNLVLIASALGVGLGFGLQKIFNNFLSGIIILFQSHLKVGDYIELDSGLRGEIREINVSSTVITTNDGIEVIIPNAEMISNRIVNWTLRDPYRRVHVPFSVAYGSDLEKVSEIVVESAKNVQSTLKKIGVREPQVLLTRLGDNGIELELRVWVNEKWTRRHIATCSQYLFAIEKALREHQIVVPYPQRELHLKSGFSAFDPKKHFTELDR